MSGNASPDRQELNRNLIIVVWTAPAAVAIFLLFHRIYENIAVTAAAVGQVDSSTETALAMGWVTMFGGTGVFAVIAIVAAVRATRAWSRLRRTP